MSAPERRAVAAPPLFDGFHERTTRGQRRRRRRDRVYTAIAAVQRRVRRR